MTSDSTSSTPRKAPRRRVTRAAGGPAAAGTGTAGTGTAVPDLGMALPEGPEAPVSAREAPARETPAPETPAPASVAAPVVDEAPAPARRSRRASRPVQAPPAGPAPAADLAADLGLADIVLPERTAETTEAPRTQVTAGRSTGKSSRRVVRSLDDIELPAGPVPPTAPDAKGAEAPAAAPAEAQAPRRRRRAAQDVEAPAAEAPSAADAAAEARRPAADAAAEAAPAPARRSRSRAKTAPAATAETSAATDETSAATAETPAAQPAVEAATAETEASPAESPAHAPRARRSRAAKAEQPAAEVPAAPTDTPAGEKKAEAAPSATARPQGTGSPRLATTALLFQAPDLTTAPRAPRRAQAPAGPPKFHDLAPVEAAEGPATEQLVSEAPAKPAAKQRGAEAPAKPQVELDLPQAAPARTRKGGERKRAPRDVSEIVLPEAGSLKDLEAAPAPAAAPARTLTGEEAAAADEVAAIEAELAADGVELVDLAPEDLVEDLVEDEEIELDEHDDADERPRRRRRRGGRGRRTGTRRSDGEDDEHDDDAHAEDAETDEDHGDDADYGADSEADSEADGEDGGSRRRRRRRRGSRAERAETSRGSRSSDEVTALKGSTRLEAKRQRRREGRDAGRRRQIITEAEFLTRRESVNRSMIVREKNGRTQIAVLEDGVLVEHYVSQQAQASMVGNVYLGRVQNVLPSMEAAFVDVGRGRNAVLYAGEVNWDAAGLEANQQRKIESALKSGDSVLVQVSKDPIGHKGARLTSQITLAGRYLVLVPGGGMTGISRKLPDVERNRLKKILRDIVPESAGVIVRTAAEGASEEELRADVERLQAQWTAIQTKAGRPSTSAPALLQGEPDLAIRVVRDIFNDDFSSLVVQGDGAWNEVSTYVEELAPDLRERVSKWFEPTDVFTLHRVDEQLAKGMDRKVWLPSGGSLVIDRTEAMTVIDVNTGKFTGTGGTLEETVTRNNLEAAEEIVRQLRLRDIGGIIVIDFVDMVLESNRDLVLRRLVECLGRDRTKHQVAEVTSLGLVQMTRKRVGQGLVEAFSETCEHCKGRGFIVHTEPIEKGNGQPSAVPAAEDAALAGETKRARRRRGTSAAKVAQPGTHTEVPKLPDEKSQAREAVKATLATIAAAAAHAHEHEHAHETKGGAVEDVPAAE